LPYLDQSRALDSAGQDLLIWLYKSGDRMAQTLADHITDMHGILNPSVVEPVLWRSLDEAQDGSDSVFLFVMARWYTVMERQKTITDKNLETMKAFVTRWMETNHHGFGVVNTGTHSAQYHPLASYSALYTKAYPGRMVDLLEVYAARAESSQDKQLQIHLIDSFGDLRHPLYDYLSALRILVPYVNTKDKDLQTHLITSLGNLHGMYSSPVEHFLLESDAPRELVNAIRSRSYERPSNDLYAGFSQLVSDIFAFAPPEFVQQLNGIITTALQQKNIGRAGSSVITSFLKLSEQIESER
jgi:hypothetical protein